MVSNRYFAHISLAGSKPSDRIRAAGYMNNVRRWYVGENLVWGAGPFSRPVDRVRALMHSPAHRANMLQTSFREVGVWVSRHTPVHAVVSHAARPTSSTSASPRTSAGASISSSRRSACLR